MRDVYQTSAVQQTADVARHWAHRRAETSENQREAVDQDQGQRRAVALGSGDAGDRRKDESDQSRGAADSQWPHGPMSSLGPIRITAITTADKRSWCSPDSRPKNIPACSRNARRRAELRDERIRRAQQSEPTRACQRTSDPHAGFPLKEHRNDDHKKKGPRATPQSLTAYWRTKPDRERLAPEDLPASANCCQNGFIPIPLSPGVEASLRPRPEHHHGRQQ